MSGDNQYRCGRCNQLRDATRRVEILELPQYLHFTLMRFTYDIKDEERKKSKAVIRYPKQTRFAGFDYDLSAVVTHLGPSVGPLPVLNR
jgi:ubiquitin carboxyl-terminal hydrolase 48